METKKIPAEVKAQLRIRLFGQMTKVARGCQHPFFFQSAVNYTEMCTIIDEEASEAIGKVSTELAGKSKNLITAAIEEIRAKAAADKANAKVMESEYEKHHATFDGKTSSKFEKVLELVQSLDGQKVVIFSDFTGPLDALGAFLASHGIKATTHYGGQNNEENKKAFLNPETDINVLLCSRGSGGVGVNLPCQYAIMLDTEYSAAQRKQNIGRITRPLVMEKYGLKCEWTVYYVIHDEEKFRTVEHWKLDLMKRKACDTYEFDKLAMTDADSDEVREAPKVDESKLVSLKNAYPGGEVEPPQPRRSSRKRKASAKAKDADEVESSKKVEPKTEPTSPKTPPPKSAKRVKTETPVATPKSAKRAKTETPMATPKSAKRAKTETPKSAKRAKTEASDVDKIADLEAQIAALKKQMGNG